MTQSLVFRLPEVVAFEHKFFVSFDSAHFRLDSSDAVPVFTFDLGHQTVTLPFDGIKREFAIPEFAADAVMLNTIARALQFVTVLRPGDPIPPEVTSGGSSWAPGDAHREAARRIIERRLIAWSVNRGTPAGAEPGRDSRTGENRGAGAVHFALNRLSAELSPGSGGRQIVADLLEEATDEFAYIEAIREKFLAVRRVYECLRRTRRALTHHASMIGEVDPVLRLISIPLRSLGAKLADADAMSKDIVSLFASFEAHREAVRDIRDDLHCRLKPWDDIVEAWRQVPESSVDPYAVLPLLRELYRFLAPRYMPADTWVLMLAADKTREESRTVGNVVTWYERRSDVA